MTTVTFAGFGAGTGYDSYQPLYSNGIGLPTGRAMASGSTDAMLVALSAYVSGNGAARTISLSLAGASTSSFGVAASSSAQSTGLQSTSTALVNGGSSTFYIYTSGSVYFGRTSTSGSNNVFDGHGSGFTGTLSGSYEYFTAPTAAQSLSAVASTTAGQINLSWTAPSDNGGTTVTSYDVWRDGSLIGNSTGLTYTDTGLNAGDVHSYVVYARNAVTDKASDTAVGSNSSSATVPGVPSAPQSLTAVASTTVVDDINLSWSAPSNVAGGITGYDIYSSGTKIASITGTGTTYAATGLTPNISYTFTVRARNAYADANSTNSVDSNTATATSPGVPTAPQSLTAIASTMTAGEINLSWTAPTTTGTGGITGYRIYYSSGTYIGNVTGTGTTYAVTGLTPGTGYSFYVTARNAIGDASSTDSAASNTATATALGAPAAPTGLSVSPSTTVANRLVLTWTAPSGSITGYGIFTTGGTFVGRINSTTYIIDGLTAGTSYGYYVEAANVVTDQTNSYGPASTSASGIPGSTSSQTVPNTGISNPTNGALSGTFPITVASATSFTYNTTVTNLPLESVSGVTAVDQTNTSLNGAYTIATPTTSTFTFTYPTSIANLSTTGVPSGTATDTSNAAFNGTFTLSSVSSSGTGFVSYPLTHANLSTTAATGTVSDTTNTVFNTTSGSPATITSVPTTKSLTYAKTNANVALSAASGTVTDQTNELYYNTATGVPAVVTSVPAPNELTYYTASLNLANTAVDPEVAGGVSLANSGAELEVQFRSGWAG